MAIFDFCRRPNTTKNSWPFRDTQFSGLTLNFLLQTRKRPVSVLIVLELTASGHFEFSVTIQNAERCHAHINIDISCISNPPKGFLYTHLQDSTQICHLAIKLCYYVSWMWSVILFYTSQQMCALHNFLLDWHYWVILSLCKLLDLCCSIYLYPIELSGIWANYLVIYRH